MAAQLDAERCAKVIKEVTADIDRFLDPSVLKFVGPCANLPAKFPEPGTSAFESLPAALRVESLNLRKENETHRLRLEEERQEFARFRSEADRRDTQAAVALAKAKREYTRLETEHDAKRRRLGELETDVTRLKREKETLSRDLSDQASRAKRDLESLERQRITDQRRAESEQVRLTKKLETLKNVNAEVDPGRCAQSEQALRSRISELESEASSLRLALEQSSRDREFAAVLRQQHRKYEEELQELRGVQKDFTNLQEKHSELEFEAISLRSQVAAREASLFEADAIVRTAATSQHDLQAFGETARIIIEEARRLEQPEEQGSQCAEDFSKSLDVSTSPAELSLAWSRSQRLLAFLRREREVLQRQLEHVRSEGCEAANAVSRLQDHVAMLQDRSDAQEAELRRAQNESVSFAARVSVLRGLVGRSLEKSGKDESSVSQTGIDPEILTVQLASAESRASDLQERLAARAEELQRSREEARSLRDEAGKVADLDAKCRQLSRVNAELWTANENLERQQDALSKEVESRRQMASLRTPPSSSKPAESLPNVGSQGESDIAQSYARFQKHVRDHILSFREGVLALLGWNVKVLQQDGQVLWQLTSLYSKHADQSLMFKLLPAEDGHEAAFDLLQTPWAKELVQDRQARAYLEVCSSVPSFLAHATMDLVTGRTEPISGKLLAAPDLETATPQAADKLPTTFNASD